VNATSCKLAIRRPRVQHALFSAAIASVCTGAVAQSNVTISGALDAGVAYVKTKSTSQMQLATGSISASSLVFQGTEDLGGGYGAYFLLRTLFFPDSGEVSSGRLYGSESKVGLQGPQGKLELGRLFNPTHQALVFKSPSQSNFGGAFNMALGGYAPYWNDSVRYTSPSFAGATLIVQQGFGDTGISGNNNGKGTVVAVNYDKGPLALSGVYESVDATVLPAVDYKAKRATVMGVWDFKSFKVHAGYYNETHSGRGAPAEFDVSILGASTTVYTSTRLTAEFGHKNFKGSSDQVNFIGLAAFYSLSKRTMLYSEITLITNGGAAKQSVYRTFVPNPGENQSGYMVGLRHNF
jgi:predicted porin